MFSRRGSGDSKRKNAREDQGGDLKWMRSGGNSPLPQSGQPTASLPATRESSSSPSQTSSVTATAPAVLPMAVLSGSSTNNLSHTPSSKAAATGETHASDLVPQVTKSGNRLLNGLKKSMNVLEKGSKLCPPLQCALSDVIELLDVIHITPENQGIYEEMSNELSIMSERINQYLERLGSEEKNGTIARIANLITYEARCIDKQRYNSAIQRTLESEEGIKHFRRIEALFRQLLADMAHRSWEIADSHFQISLLDRLAPAKDARYNSSYSMTIKRQGCTAKTREQLLNDLQDWVQDPNGAKVYWMNGMAGTGKTTVAYSLCEWLEENHLLGASFFCSRISPSCSNPNRIVPTIAYLLGRYSPAFQSQLYKTLKEDPDAGQLNVALQFEKLIRDPLLKVQDATPDGVVVVIDALDECTDSYSVRRVLETLLGYANSLPLKFFIASRPEPTIQSQMQSTSGYCTSLLHLHEIEQSIVGEDIKKYLRAALSTMIPPPSDNQVEQLAEPAGKLFIYAATIVRYILPDDGWGNSGARLKTMLATGTRSSRAGSGSKVYKKLDDLYEAVLTAAFHDKLEDQEIEAMQSVIKAAICAKEPTTAAVLASLLGLGEQAVTSSLQPLQSVLHLSADGTISTLHASFPDYILDHSRSGAFPWYCNKTLYSRHLTKCCLGTMKNRLKFNICGLQSSFLLDRDIPDLEERVEQAIDPALLYACRFWADHLQLCDASGSETLHTMLSEFLARNLLFWIEVLNLRGHIGEGEQIMKQAESWIGLHDTSRDNEVHIADARNFVMMFAASACRHSTCHLYLSAVEFFRSAASVHEHFRKRLRGSIKIGGTLAMGRGGVPLARWGVGSEVLSVATSHDGTRIVSGSYDRAIRVWDAQTGRLIVGPLEGHSSLVTSVEFSPDDGRIVSGSDDMTIRVWDAQAGNLLAGPFRGHTNRVTLVAFILDGTRIVSGSDDETVRVWDVQTGNLVAGPFRKQTSRIVSLGFSADRTRTVSGSYDGTIRVWDSQTGDLITGPFRGHTSLVTSMAFSPNSTLIVSGSYDRTIRVCDARTGEIVAGPFKGHTSWVTSVAFSPDGHRIVSGSDDMTIRVWDTRSGSLVSGPFRGHESRVISVAFSLNGTRIVSGSDDKTIRVWDTKTGNLIVRLLCGHIGEVSPINETPIASGSPDGTVQAQDPRIADLVVSRENQVYAPRAPTESNAHNGRCTNTPEHFSSDYTIQVPCNDGQCGPSDMATKSWEFNPDGWVTCEGMLLFWAPPDLHKDFPVPPAVVGNYQHGTLKVDSWDILLGERWTECYIDE